MREYLEIFGARRYSRREWRTRIDAVEVFPAYISPLHNYIYNRIIIGDIRQVVGKLGNYDWILAGDILEHLPKSDAIKVASRLYGLVNQLLIVIVPKSEGYRGAIFGNPNEAHQCFLVKEDFLGLGIPEEFDFAYQRMWWWRK